MIKTSFRSLIEKYDAILLDSYGVLKNYNGIIDGVQDTLQIIRDQKKRYRILTNDASTSAENLSQKFKQSGIILRPHRIITSGLMAQNFLATKRIEGKVLYLGTDISSDFIIASNKERISINDYENHMFNDIGCVIFLDDEGYNWNTALNKVVNLLRRKSVPAIVANSDLIYPVSREDVSVATGGLAKVVEHIMGYRFIHFGKPDIQMFLHAYHDLKVIDPDLEKTKILMVGDTLHTDILGAVKFGINAALVLSGNTTENNVEWKIRASGIAPDYVCDSILV